VSKIYTECACFDDDDDDALSRNYVRTSGVLREWKRNVSRATVYWSVSRRLNAVHSPAVSSVRIVHDTFLLVLFCFPLLCRESCNEISIKYINYRPIYVITARAEYRSDCLSVEIIFKTTKISKSRNSELN